LRGPDSNLRAAEDPIHGTRRYIPRAFAALMPSPSSCRCLS